MPLFYKTSCKPKHLWKVSSMRTISECQADYRSPEPIKSIRFFCKHNKIGKNCFKPLKLPLLIILFIEKLCHSFGSNFFDINFKILQQLLINFWCCSELQNLVGNVSRQSYDAKFSMDQCTWNNFGVTFSMTSLTVFKAEWQCQQ